MEQDFFRLYPMPSFIDGFARAIDLGGTLNRYNSSSSDAEADMKAIKSDWDNILFDLKNAYEMEKREWAKNEKSRK